MVDKQHGQRVRSRTAQALEMVEAGMQYRRRRGAWA